MAGVDNLRVPTSEEAREIGRKGGIASGKARRRRKEFKAVIEQALNTELPNEKIQEKLEKLGFDPTFQSAIALKVVEKATKGNLRAAELISDIDKNKKDNLDKREQRARIKRLELENEKLKALLSSTDEGKDRLSELMDMLKDEALKDGD